MPSGMSKFGICENQKESQPSWRGKSSVRWNAWGRWKWLVYDFARHEGKWISIFATGTVKNGMISLAGWCVGNVYSHLSDKYFLTIFDVPDTVLDLKDTSEKKMCNETCLLWISFIMGQRQTVNNIQIKNYTACWENSSVREKGKNMARRRE